MPKVRVGDVVYRVRLVPSSRLADGELGRCDAPDNEKDFPEIWVSEDLNGITQLDTLVHETVHAVLFDLLDEKAVSRIGTAVAKVLWAMGWRLSKELN